MSEDLPYIASEGHILYRSLIRDSMHDAGFLFKKKDPCSTLVWYDDLRKKDFYGPMKPWQIVNRFPMINVLCRKAPFVRLIQRTAQKFPDQFKFLPKSFLVPIQEAEFEDEVHKNETRWIVKPDKGSLGAGIRIIEIGGTIPRIERLCVAQKYIPSFHIDDYKFDFRIYALVASVDPLVVYVYRNGVARFCSKKANEHSVFAELTNKSLNKKNPDVVMTQIVKMIADVMDRLKEEGHDTDRLWKRIDHAIVSTVITGSKFMSNGMEKQCPRIGIQRCFQILGVDVLLDDKLNPYILEVNYRPSLETNAPYERKMKRAMLSDTMKIMAPAQEFQDYINDNYDEKLEERWFDLIKSDPKLKKAIDLTNNKKKENTGGFVLAYPSRDKKMMSIWNSMIEYVSEMPSTLKTPYFLPQPFKTSEAKDSARVKSSSGERERIKNMHLDSVLDHDKIKNDEQDDDELETAIDEAEERRADELDPYIKKPKRKKSGKSSGKGSKRSSAKGSKRSSRKNSPGEKAKDPGSTPLAPPKKDVIRHHKREAKEDSSDEGEHVVKHQKRAAKRAKKSEGTRK